MLRQRPLNPLHLFRRHSRIKQSHRPFSTPPPQPQPPGDSRSRLRMLNDRLPLFLRSYTTPLLEAPVTHVTSFLILHEITAILPLFGLAAAFHYGNWMPDLGSGASGVVFAEAVDRFGRWLRKKGWVSDDAVDEAASMERKGEPEAKGARLVLEFASAYVLTKALLPVRIAASVWATPWFARTILSPVNRGVGRLVGRK